MRLQIEQIEQIQKVLKSHFIRTPYQLYLYGSRTQNDLKGGDIDLLILTSDEGVLLFKNNELQILVDIKKQPAIGQRRIDLKASTQEEFSGSPFWQSLSHQLVRLE